MTNYIIRRFLYIIPVLIGISLITFILMHSVPGGPFDTEGIQSPETIKRLNEKYHLDEPLYKQYLIYIKNLARGNLGVSFRYKNITVNEIILSRFKISLIVGSFSIIFTFFVGIILGIIAALKQNSYIDYIVMFFATVGYSIPNFAASVFLIIIFSLTLKLLPVAGWGTYKHIILPALALSLPWTSFLARLTRTSIIEVLRSDFIRTARAKGVKEKVIIYKHCLRNAFIPIVTILGTIVSQLITGSMAIETIFGLPGIGQYMVISIKSADYSMIMGLAIFFSIIVVITNLIVDISYAVIDPRIKYS